MSFILDALKKSENDRQRQTGPALFEVKVAPPKAGFPVWAIAIVVLLVINMVIVGWLLLHRSSKSGDTADQNTAPPAAGQQAPTPVSGIANTRVGSANNGGPSQRGYPPPAQYNGSSPQQAYSPTNVQGSGSEQAPGRDQNEPTLAANAQRAAGTGNPAGNGSYGSGANSGGNGSYEGAGHPGNNGSVGNPAGGAGNPGGNGSGAGNAAGGGSYGGGNAGANGGNVASGRNAGGPAEHASRADPGAGAAGGNPDDYAPAQDAGGPIFKGHVRRGTESGLMLYQDLATANGANLPELRLDMHVYDPKPQARFALINMQKVTEGQMVKGEVRVEAITPEGVVLSHNGTKFLLPRD
jgi:hypothetical protein